MAQVNGRPKRKNSFSPPQQKKRTTGDGRPAASYRETTRGLLDTFPDLPTGPSGLGRRNRASGGGLTSQQSRVASGPSARNSEMEDAVDDTMELQQDDEDYFSAGGDGDDGMFSSQSCGNSTERSDGELMDALYKSKNLVDLPAWGWAKILPQLHPLELAQLQLCCQLFNTLVQKDAVWRRSRSTHLPEFPKPVFGLSEREMFRLLFARKCMLCENQGDIETYWPFRIRCCKQCLSDNTTKEFSLESDDEPFPAELLVGLPFGMVDMKNNWVPEPSSYQADIGITKIYWNKDLESIKHRYQEVEEMLASDEWLKGLESKRNFYMQDIERMERFEKTRPADLSTASGLWKSLRAENTSNTGIIESENQPQDPDEIMQEPGDPGAVVNIAKQREIEARCRKLDPPLTLETLIHLPSFQASVMDDNPLDEASWMMLETSLSEERQMKRERQWDTAVEINGKTESHTSGRSSNSQKGLAEHSDSVQLSNREKLLTYAGDAIQSWEGTLTMESAPAFAAHVLSRCGKQFYADESTRRKRVTLEDMKYVYDSRVKPKIHQFRTEIFLCDGCSTNLRWWNFESLVQHFSAKHTYSRRGKHPKVDWRADWPEIGPFRADPDKSLLESPLGEQPEGVPPHAPSGPMREMHRSSYAQKWSQGLEQHIPTAPRNGHVQKYNEEARQTRLDALAADAKAAWALLASLRNIPPSIHIHFVIIRTARKYQSRFSEAIPLGLFLDALIEHPAMSSIKYGVKGLRCIECQRHPGKTSEGASKADRVFPIVSLLQHFETVHIARNKSVVLPDWTRDMVRLPHPRIISDLADALGKDTRHLIEDIFPWAFGSANRDRAGSMSGRSGPASAAPPGVHRRADSEAVAPRYPNGQYATPRYGGPPVSRDRLQQIEFAGDVRQQHNRRAEGFPLSAPVDYVDRPKRTFNDGHGGHQTNGMARTEYVRDRDPHHSGSTSRYEGQRRQLVEQDTGTKTGIRPPRPTAVDYIVQQPAPRVGNTRYDYERYASPREYAPSEKRQRSRSPDRRYPVSMYTDPRYAYPPPVPLPPPPHAYEYLRQDRAAAAYYAPPPPPLPRMPPPPSAGYYYAAGSAAPRDHGFGAPPPPYDEYSRYHGR
ncbi:hypothetical protein BZA05DRAFT_407092 [Tricharina praecox]|uniref:uncharacterized protein n=1 Tax=Tricharina praecox TaxID=43433 RepID=UPI0022206999|nr:uncharacterized protein BZA05DRAFT_407092 [Tricharina praecox]KAI5846155.1 hypothetical protein BZA05DRAFT_407092 [Tricharina praecox]